MAESGHAEQQYFARGGCVAHGFAAAMFAVHDLDGPCGSPVSGADPTDGRRVGFRVQLMDAEGFDAWSLGRLRVTARRCEERLSASLGHV